MRKRNLLFTLGACLFGLMMTITPISAQQLPISTHYTFNRYTLDPAFAGAYDNAAVFLNYRRDWGNIEGSPQTFRINGFGQVYQNMYIGGEILADNTDIFNRIKANLNYTYRLQMANSQFLSFALGGSFYQSVIRFDQVNADLDDPLLRDLDRITGSNFNANFGLIYNWNHFHLGFGLPVLFRSKDTYNKGADAKFTFDRSFLIHVSNRFRLADLWQLQAFGVYQKTDNQPSVVDVSATAFYDDKYHIGLMYRSSNALVFGVGGELLEGFVIGYSYEMGFGGVYNGSGGAHEITVGYRITTKNLTHFYDARSARKKYPTPSRPVKPGPKPVEFNRR